MSSDPDPDGSAGSPRGGAGKGSVFKSARWNTFGAGSVQLVRFGVSLIVFRMLGPARVGLMDMALVVVGFLDWFKDFGTGQAVVQAKELRRGFLSTVFFTNLALAAVLSLCTWLGADAIAWLFHEPEVAPLLPVLGLSFLISAFGLVQRNLYARELRFDRLARANLLNAASYGVTAIALAASGFGVWSLVYATLVGYTVANASLWFGSSWRPGARVSLEHLLAIRGFCVGILGSNLVNYLLQVLDRIVVGRFLGKEALGLYALAMRLVRFPVKAVSQTLLSVMLPAFSRLQDDLPQYREKYLRAVGGIALVTVPMMAGLAAVAPALVHGFMKEKWIEAIPLVVVLSPLGIVLSVAMTTGTIYVSLGRTKLMMRWSLIFGLAALVGYLAGVPWGIQGVAIAATLSQCALAYFYFAVPFRLIELPIGQLARTLAPLLGAGILMGLAVWGLRLGLERGGLDARAVVVLCVPAGVLLYAVAIWRLRPPALGDLGKLLLPRLRRAGSGSGQAG